jgi:hypothetical protein
MVDERWVRKDFEGIYDVLIDVLSQHLPGETEVNHAKHCPGRDSNQALLEYNSFMCAAVSSFLYVHTARFLIKHRHSLTFHLSYRNNKEWMFKDGNVANQSQGPCTDRYTNSTHGCFILFLHWDEAAHGSRLAHETVWSHSPLSTDPYFHFMEYLPIASKNITLLCSRRCVNQNNNTKFYSISCLAQRFCVSRPHKVIYICTRHLVLASQWQCSPAHCVRSLLGCEMAAGT